MDAIDRILDLVALSERLKRELRHSWLADGRQESVAEHTWQMAFLALLVHRRLTAPVDLLRLLKMILVHDLVEAIAGDVPFFETGARKTGKAAREAAAIEEIRSRIGGPEGEELHELWHAFEAGQSQEAKVAHALDHLEVQMQHNLAELSTWEPVEYGLIHTKMVGPCAFDPFLAALAARVTAQAEAKIRAAGMDPVGAATSPAP